MVPGFRRFALPIVAAASAAVGAFLPAGSPPRVIAGVLLVLVLPGAAFGRAALAQDERLPERAATAFAVSIVLAGVLGLVCDVVGISLSSDVWLAALAGSTIAFAVAAPAVAKRSQPIRWRRPRLRRRDVVFVALAVALVAGAFVVATRPLEAPADTRGYTALWLQPEERGVRAVVRSDEFHRARYRLVVKVGGKIVASPAAFSLDPRQAYRYRLRQSVATGTRVDALLYLLDRGERPYRRADFTYRRPIAVRGKA